MCQDTIILGDIYTCHDSDMDFSYVVCMPSGTQKCTKKQHSSAIKMEEFEVMCVKTCLEKKESKGQETHFTCSCADELLIGVSSVFLKMMRMIWHSFLLVAAAF